MKTPQKNQPLSQHTCDCHTHVFLDEREFPLWPSRRYTPPPAPIEALLELHQALGIQRVVIVQPSVYGLDNSSTLHALRVIGADRARGVAVIDENVSDATLDSMTAAGIRGVRVNLEIDGESDSAKAAGQMLRIAERVAPRGWHVQLYASLPLLAACRPTIEALPVPVVFDHFAGAQAGPGLNQEGIGEVLGLVESGKAYVKLSAAYRFCASGRPDELGPLAKLLIQCNPDRMLWGSDWPHPRPASKPNAMGISAPFEVDLAGALDALREWSADTATLHRILVDNPQRLYGFGD